VFAVESDVADELLEIDEEELLLVLQNCIPSR
jgi:hypothetical protein